MSGQRAQSTENRHLTRALNTPMLAIYGAGTILGAGIFVLIGELAGEAGLWLPLAFLLAAIVAAVNGMAFAELATRLPSAGGPAAYVRKAYSSEVFWRVIAWLIAATGVVSAATIANGFAGYLELFFTLPPWVPTATVIVLLGALAAVGVKEAVWFMVVSTTLGLLGLLFVTYVGFFDAPAGRSAVAIIERLPPLSVDGQWIGVAAAAYLAVYAYIGFEHMVHMAEEVRRPAKAMPIAILVAIGVAATLYLVVSVAALRTLEPSALAESGAPLVAVVEAAGYPGWPLALLSLWMIVNGALAQLLMASRVLYDLGTRGGAPRVLRHISPRTGTPLAATAIVTATALLLAVFFPLKTLAAATSSVILLVFAASNLALIRLERSEPQAPFDTPVWLPWVGLTLCVLVLGSSLLLPASAH